MKTISLKQFAKNNEVVIGTAKNSEGQSFTTMSYKDEDGETKYINLSKKLNGWSEGDVRAHRNELQITFTKTLDDKPYCVCFLPSENAWKALFTDEELA